MMKRGFLKGKKGESLLAMNTSKPASVTSLLDAAQNLDISSGPPRSTFSKPKLKPDTTSTPGCLEYKRACAESPGQQNPPYPPFLVTTFPPQNVGDKLADHPDGWCECILESPERKRDISKIISELTKVEQPPEVRHRIDKSSFGGLGMFATKELNMGDLVFSERPLLIAPIELPHFPVVIPIDASVSEQKQAAQAEENAWFQAALSRMNPEAQASFLALVNSRPSLGPFAGRFFTNVFALDKKPFDEYAGVHNQISRINHSCLPNITVRFNVQSLASEVRAVRNVQPGEELLVSYVSTSLSQLDRQERLDAYDFKCRCPICVDPAAIALRDHIQDNANRLDPEYSEGIDDPEIEPRPKKGVDYREMITDSEKWMKVLEDAKMQESELYSKYLSVAVNAALIVQDERQMKKYLEKSLVWSKVVLV